MGALQINLLGTNFAIEANEDDAYLQKLLTYYRKITDEIQRNGNLKTPLQVAILSGIMLCDELYKEKSQKAKISQISNENEQEAERLTVEMIKLIDDALSVQ